jgi:predicted permease
MNGLLQDLRYGCRALARSPGFAIVAILTLALGIGANTAIFHVLDSAVLRALPVPHPDELVLLTDPESHGHGFGSQGGDRTILAFWEFQFLHNHNEVFSGVFAVDSDLAKRDVIISHAGKQGQESASIRLVTGEYFATLGVTPILGRAFGAEADQARGAAPFAVISYNYWTRRFAGDAAVLGTKFTLHGTPFEIIAVAPPGFFGETVGQAPDIWIPATMQDAVYPGADLLNTTPGILDQHLWLQVVARRKPHVSLSQAQANVDVVNRRLMEVAGQSLTDADRRDYSGQRIVVRPGAAGSSVLRRAFAEPLWILMALVGMVLLIACANVANLLLARHAARDKEFALRLALGAGRWRSIRQFLTESLLLGLPGAGAGFVLAQWADALLLRAVRAAGVGSRQLELDVHPDARMLLFTTLVALVTTILFGLFPALRLTRLDLSEALKAGPGAGIGGPARRRFSAGKLLLIGQVAASLVILVTTGLFAHSLVKLSQVSLGFNRDHLLAFSVDPVAAGWKGPAIFSLHERLLQALSSIPGVRAVTVCENGLFEESDAGDPIAVEGYTPAQGERMNSAMEHVGPNYFSTVGIPVLMGREIGAQDSHAGERVGLVNQTFVQRFFPKTSPLGKRVTDTYYPGKPSTVIIVGVVADAKHNSVREKARPRLYAPFFQPLWDNPKAVYEVRTFGDPAAVGTALRGVVNAAAPALPAIEIQSVAELVDNSLGKDRLIARLSAVFSVLAMLLASIGLFGVMSWTMARRTREIGIRMATGALPGTIFRLVLRETFLTVSFGLAIGIPLALVATRLIRSLLFGLGAADPLVIVTASILLLAVAGLAAYLPARRAARVDPINALRYE